jgi:hypothetical protein
MRRHADTAIRQIIDNLNGDATDARQASTIDA